MTTAQTLYDLRDDYAFCSGTDLHEFFAAQTGDPSPSGKVEVDADSALEFVRRGAGPQRPQPHGLGPAGHAGRPPPHRLTTA